MGFWNKERKMYAMIVLGGALAYLGYRKFTTPVAPATTTPTAGAMTNFTGAAYYSADGGCGCGCGGHCGRSCEQLATELATVRAHISNGHNYTTDHVTMLHHRETELLAKMATKGCSI